jgi:hypothetical protein
VVLTLVTVRAGVDAQDALSVRGRRDLRFGTVLRGVPTVVDPFVRSSGRWEIRGESNAEVRIDLVLPTALTTGTGIELPLSFGSADGAYSSHPQGRGARVVDPQLPLITAFDERGKLYVFLGGTALPGAMQPAGEYAAIISLTVSYTGN